MTIVTENEAQEPEFDPTKIPAFDPNQNYSIPNMNTPNNQRNHTVWSFGAGSPFTAPIPQTVYNDDYTKIKEGLIEIYKHSAKNIEVTLLDLDNVNDPGLAFSNIIVVIRDRQNPNALAYHILVLESTGEKILPTYDNVGGVQTEIQRFTCNGIDDVLRAKASEKVIKAFNVPNVYYTEATIVPEGFDPEDKRKLHMLALNVGLACTTELTVRSPDFNDLNLAQAPKDSGLYIAHDFSKQQTEDIVGNRVRSDVTTTFGYRKQAQSTKSIHSSDRDTNLATSTGFIDLLWSPLNQQTGFNPYATQQQTNQTQKYVARLVITDLVSNFGHTPAMILMALATASTIRDNNSWINTFRPSPMDAGGIDLRDIGALNIEANLENDPSGFGRRPPTKSEDFKLTDLGDLISALIRPGLVISLDCPEGGVNSWYLSIFAAASRGSARAADVIYNAAQQLTNGSFGRVFPQGSPMFVDTFNTIHMGYWIDRKGLKRDLRDIDHLATCNIVGDRNPELIRAYSDTFLRKDIPLVKRLADRKKLIMAFTNETAVFTGYAERVTFDSKVIAGLGQGIVDSGMLVRINSQALDDINQQRGVPDFINNSLVTNNSGFVVSNTPYTASMYNNFGGNTGRW